MAAKEVAKNKIICSEGQALEAVHIIASGSVLARFPGGEIVLKKGDIVGLCDIAYDSHFFTYTTLEDSAFVSFPFKDHTSLQKVIKVNPEVSKMMYTSMLNQINQLNASLNTSRKTCVDLYNTVHSLYSDYIDCCARNNIISRSLPEISELDVPNMDEVSLPQWVEEYYHSISEFPQDLKFSLVSRTSFLIGFLYKASEDIHASFDLSESVEGYLTDVQKLFIQDSNIDLFDLYTTLIFRLKQGTPDYEKTLQRIELISEIIKKSNYADTFLFENRTQDFKAKLANLSIATNNDSKAEAVNAELNNSVDIILEYADIDEATAFEFKSLLSKYKKLPDKASTDESARRLRLELTKLFYKVYSEAFTMSIMDRNVPPILKMFFNFGFVDAELCGMDNANYLYGMANMYRGDEELGVYTIYEWLNAIFRLKKDPSRNEFDVDYLEYLREQRVQGKIDAETEKRLVNDPGERVIFELNNMFPMVNKVTYGRLSSFCPVLSESDIIKPLQNCIVTCESIKESFKKIEAIDYGAFYREITYTNESVGIAKEYLNAKVTPDIILMPNIGTRGVMWQEIEGKKRNTPARFMISVFHMEDLVTTFTRLTGEFRWEMCKRMQGARWNDVSERSLTSEYFDYVQFYRKNNDLSQDAKEKVKASLTKAKNSFKEMFVRDYITWIMFEGTGSPRLNKVARSILLTYCPFPKELRDKIQANPLFKELIERYNIKSMQKMHHIDNVITKLRSSGLDVPEEFIVERNYINGTL